MDRHLALAEKQINNIIWRRHMPQINMQYIRLFVIILKSKDKIITPAPSFLLCIWEDQNQDYFWAARGTGPGLFAVATRYHLKLYPLPKSITSSLYYYAYDDMESVSNWLGVLASKLPNNVELSFGFDMPFSKNTYYDFGV